jgi:hypothetical protein
MVAEFPETNAACDSEVMKRGQSITVKIITGNRELFL